MTQLDKRWKSIRWVLTDVDDTLTCDGHLPPEALMALSQLRENGYKVIAVTGASAGWCDHIAHLWPVDAVLGENGAFIMEKIDGCLSLNADVSLAEMRQKQAKLKHQVEALLREYPDLLLTLDQSWRLCEVAVDIGQNRPMADQEQVSELLAKIHQLGANASVSSIHINAWYGDHSKRNTALVYLKKQGLTEAEIFEQACYVGDSLNDQQMFEILPKTAGVANIKKYWDRLQHKPAIVMTKPGGYGFAEFVDQFLTITS